MSQGFGKRSSKNRRKSRSNHQTSADTLQESLKLAIAAQQNRQLPQAIELCESILNSHSNYPDAWYLLGVIKRQQNKIESAISAFENLLQLQPKNVTVLSNLGVLCVQDRQPNRAIDYFSRAIELNPNYVQAYTNLGQLHFLYRSTTQGNRLSTKGDFPRPQVRYGSL